MKTEINAELAGKIVACFDRGLSIEEIVVAWECPYAAVEAVLIEAGKIPDTAAAAVAKKAASVPKPKADLEATDLDVAAEDIRDIRKILRRSKSSAANTMVELLDSEDDGIRLKAATSIIRELGARDDDREARNAKLSFVQQMNELMSTIIEEYKTKTQDEPIEILPVENDRQAAIDISAETIL